MWNGKAYGGMRWCFSSTAQEAVAEGILANCAIHKTVKPTPAEKPS